MKDSATALQQFADVTILSWGIAFALASENAQGLIDGTLPSDVASQRMAVLEEAEQKMMALPDLVSPPALIRFRQAKADKGCGACWLSSRRAKNHPDCNRKIREYFAARAALLRWIESGIRQPAAPAEATGDE